MDHLKVFLHSLYLNGGGHWPIVLDLIDGDKSIDAKLKAINPDILIINHVTSEIIDVPEKERDDIPLYNLNVMWSRPLGIVKMLKQGYGKLLTMDTDIIIRGDISKLWEDLKPGTIKWHYRPDKKKVGTKVQGGVIAFGNSPEIRQYYNKVIERCQQNKGPFVMQESLYYVYMEMKPRLIDIGRKYNDDGVFEKSSRIWHCKHGHYEDKPWKKEYEKYLIGVK